MFPTGCAGCRHVRACADPLSTEGGSQRRSGAGNANRLFAGAFPASSRDGLPRARSRMCRETARLPARARSSQNVRASYPRRVQIASAQTTTQAHLQGFYRSPLTDSNRRPPPYHGGALPAELRGRVQDSSRLRAGAPLRYAVPTGCGTRSGARATARST
jgi:hypothetical protein